MQQGLQCGQAAIQGPNPLTRVGRMDLEAEHWEGLEETKGRLWGQGDSAFE